MASEILERLSAEEHVRKSMPLTIQRFKCQPTYLSILDLTPDLEGVVHVAGTKGKGSTCTLLDSVLRSCGYRTGLFTSPHLYDVRERIQINGELVEEDLFSKNVIWCFEKLSAAESEDVPFPTYFTFLTLVALRVFVEAKLDAMILEVGLGGRLDPTNVIRRPWVCGVTSIGIDHVEVLGSAIDIIAWEKGGILKKDVPAYSTPQDQLAMETLQFCARNAGTQLQETTMTEFSNWNEIKTERPFAGFQWMNATLAVKLAQEFEKQYLKRNPNSSTAILERMRSLDAGRRLPGDYLQGLSKAKWMGRAQIIDKPELLKEDGSYSEVENLRLYLDGAHTNESLAECVKWIQHEWQKRDAHTLDFLLFHCQQPRNPHSLLRILHQTLQSYQLMPHHVFFAPLIAKPRLSVPVPVLNKMEPTEWLMKQLSAWRGVSRSTRSPESPVPLPSLVNSVVKMDSVEVANPDMKADVFTSLNSAMNWFGALARHQSACQIRVLVTGSLYFVADVLKLVKKK